MRIIATILCKEDYVVQTYGYSLHRIIGSPQTVVKHLDAWHVDEIVLLQIDNSLESLFHNINSIANVSATPITAGGGLTTLSAAAQAVSLGADRVCVQSMLFDDINILIDCAKHLGGQAVTIKLDYSAKTQKLRHSNQLLSSFWESWWPRIDALQAYDIDDIFFNCIDSDGLIDTPDFSHLHSNDLSKHSVILGGGLSACNISSIYQRYVGCFESLSLSFSNQFYQKEIANWEILRNLHSTCFNHRLTGI